MFALHSLNIIIRNIGISIDKVPKTPMPVFLQRKKHFSSIYCPPKVALVRVKMETGNGGAKRTEAIAINLN